MRAAIPAFLMLLALPCAAQPPGHTAGRGAPTGGLGHVPPSPRPSSGGFGSHAGLPRPHQWSGNIGNFGRRAWTGGRWYHGLHDGTLAWWWITGPNWYYYNRPVYPYPDFDVPPGQPDGWWYWCPEFQEYYPYVTYCPTAWVRVSR